MHGNELIHDLPEYVLRSEVGIVFADDDTGDAFGTTIAVKGIA
jgi:hypothetical protein